MSQCAKRPHLWCLPSSHKPEHSLPFLACLGLARKVFLQYSMAPPKRTDLEKRCKGASLSGTGRVLVCDMAFLSQPQGAPSASVPPGWAHGPQTWVQSRMFQISSQTLQRVLLLAKCVFQSPEQETRSEGGTEKALSSWLAAGLGPSREINKHFN